MNLPQHPNEISLCEELMRHVYHPKRLVYYMSEYNYDINYDIYLN